MEKCIECGDRVETVNIKDGRCHICRCDFDATGEEDQVTAIGRIGYDAYIQGRREFEASECTHQ